MSVAKYVDPVSMGSADVAIRNEDEDAGYTNKCLDISEFSVAATNRELVNLENAAVNIDNSNDVIIGPVTQFNVNGNVTIYQNKDGLPIGIEQKDEEIGNDCNANFKDVEDIRKDQTERNINYIKWICFLIVVALGILTSVKLILISLHHDVPPADIILQHERFCTCNLNTLYKKDWGGVDTNMRGVNKLQEPVLFIIIKHTGGAFCQTEPKCKHLTKQLQRKHLALNYTDIEYNFLVGGDGNIYVGRGFLYSNQFSKLTYDIAVHGNFLYDQFYDYMENATLQIIEFGVTKGYIDKNYVVLCQFQTEKVDSPGRNVFEKVKLWDHYSDITYFNTGLFG